MISKYKKYKAILRNYYCQFFDDTRQSAYTCTLSKNLGPVINPSKKNRQRTINKNLFWGWICYCKSRCCKSYDYAIPDSGYDYKQYLPVKVENTFFSFTYQPTKILNENKNPSPRNSIGPDKKVIKLSPLVFAENLSLIYNKAIKSAKYYLALTVTKIIALIKKVTGTNLITIVPLACCLALTKLLKNYFVND